MNEEKEYIQSFREALNHGQLYIMAGLGASLSYLVLTNPLASPGKESIAIPGVYGPVPMPLAGNLMLALYWFIGIFASYALRQALIAAERLMNQELSAVKSLEAVYITHPSIITSPVSSPFLAILPAIIVWLAAIIQFSHHEQVAAVHSRLFRFVLFLGIDYPYLRLSILVGRFFFLGRRIDRRIASLESHAQIEE